MRYALDSALAQEGLLLSDIELVMVTHHHDDHVGLACTVRAEAPDEQTRALRRLIARRRGVVKCRTQVKNEAQSGAAPQPR
jgi:glyoxylase-like metal-dependent hydrolase (beta-lactamase superfamily II)